MKLASSILSADFANLLEDIHVDVMDGHFVPNISFGAPVMKCLNAKTNVPYDVHLMIENPDNYIADFVTPQTEYITVHQEACRHLHRTIQNIKAQGIKAGVSINPATPVDTLSCILADVDLVLIMSVNPGFGGQKFIPESLDKIRKFIPQTVSKVRELAKIKKEQGLSFAIEIDGGVTLDNAKMLAEAGVEIAVAGSAVFKAENVEDTVRKFKNL